MKGWHFDKRDTKQQRSVLRTSESAQRTRIRFAPGTRITARWGILATGKVDRHVPATNSQGGTLLVHWDNGATGRVSPIAVEPVVTLGAPAVDERTQPWHVL